MTSKEDFTLPKEEQFFTLKTGTPILSEKASIHAERNALCCKAGSVHENRTAVNRWHTAHARGLAAKPAQPFHAQDPWRPAHCDTITFLLATDSLLGRTGHRSTDQRKRFNTVRDWLEHTLEDSLTMAQGQETSALYSR